MRDWQAGQIQEPEQAEQQAVTTTPNLISIKNAMGNIGKNSYGFLISQWLSQSAVIYRNSLFSRLNSASAVAAATVAPLNYAWLTIGAGAMRSSNNFYGNYAGLELGKRWRVAVLYGLAVGIFCVMPGYLASPYAMPLLHLGSASFSLAFRYNLISMIGAPFRMVRTVDRHFFVKTNKQNLLIYLGVFQSISSCVASYFLNKIIPVEGIPLGQILGAAFGFLITLGYLFKNAAFEGYGLFRWGLLPWNDCKSLFKEGFHNGASYLAENFANIGMMIMMSLISKEALVANNIVNQAAQPFILASFSLGVGLQRALNIQNIQEGWSYFKASFLLVGMVYASSIGMYFLTPFISELFLGSQNSENQETFKLTKTLMAWAIFGGLGDHLRNINSGGQQSFKDTGFIMGTTIVCRGLIATGLSIYLGFKQSLGAEGVIIGHQVGVTLGGIAQTARLAWNIHRNSQALHQPILPRTMSVVPSSELRSASLASNTSA